MILEKKRGKHRITFVNDKDDDFFLYVIRTDKKTGEQASRSMITRKDLPDWLNWYQSLGWVNIGAKE